MKLRLALAVSCLAVAISGWSTICTAFDDHSSKSKLFSGTRISAQNHATQTDVPVFLAVEKTENPGEKETSVPVMTPSQLSVEPVAVYRLPLDDFSYDYASQLARKLSEDLKIKVRASLPMGTSDLSPFSGGTQYPAEDIIESAYKVGMRLSDRAERSALIALTGRDINDRSRQLRFLFAQHDKSKHTSVVSAARMKYGISTEPATANIIFLRIYKMIKRTIGDQYLELPRSGNINDIMYSPIMSLDDLDALGIQYLGLSNKISVPDGFIELKNREPRISSLGYSFVPPSGEKWFEGYSPKTIMYFKQTNPKELLIFAGATEAIIEENISSEKNFIDFVKSKKDDFSAHALRYKNVVTNYELINSMPSYCVAYKQTAEDHEAKNLNGNQYLMLINKGVICLHPTIKNQLVDIYYSSRAIPDLKFMEFTKEIESFIGSLKIN
ncbi:exported hypothetical protein [Candidatus Nitrotoga sp. HW29]|uniref:hypothetical protein n=1 Tax=Candidatus Nitrotoga sp. HW29 TaxID=2886963 RepID=UPI001EF2D69C|nr:hypothetical protein [Candidatus Nitrotoga sp. HW29]CAH1904195.1 exported hypothetical protein [Candidatus Nitrotoga sp. HW29]